MVKEKREERISNPVRESMREKDPASWQKLQERQFSGSRLWGVAKDKPRYGWGS